MRISKIKGKPVIIPAEEKKEDLIKKELENKIEVTKTKKSFRLKLEEFLIKTRIIITKAWVINKLVIKNAIVPSVIIMLALGLLGYPYDFKTFIGSAAFYFVIEEIKKQYLQILLIAKR